MYKLHHIASLRIFRDHEKGIIFGIIPVIFKKAVIIENNDFINVFGRIKVEKDRDFIEGKFLIKDKN